MKALFVHAHFDDYEFSTAGTFEMWRRQLGGDFRARLIICTDGAAGHHRMSREETARVRLAEQMESAKLAQCEIEQLLLPNGKAPREACLQVDSDLLAALWKAIRDFEPDYLFAPPVPSCYCSASSRSPATPENKQLSLAGARTPPGTQR